MPKGKRKSYRTVLSSELTEEVLSIPIPEDADLDKVERPEPRTIGERLERALGELEQTVEMVNEALSESNMVGIVADTLAKSLKKRGHASIVVEPDGKVVLRVDYGKVADEAESVDPSDHVKKRAWHSDLPLMDELREMAEDLGVDIDDLGRKRRAIWERLQEAKSRLRHMDEVKVLHSGDNGAGHLPEDDEGKTVPLPIKKSRRSS